MPDSSFLEVQAKHGRFLCADTVRFWSMAGVVAVHCTRVFTLDNEGDSLTFDAVGTLFKFSSIAFFLASGFLLARNLDGRSSRGLLAKRLKKVFVPWLTWTAMFVVTFGVINFFRHKDPFLPGAPVARAFLIEFERCVLGSAMWFVPNLLVGFGVLLIFRRHLSSALLGTGLLGVSLIYSANLYVHWFGTGHTRALFGFTFYLWLGHYAATHLRAFDRLLSRLTFRLLLGLCAMSALAAFGESRLLLYLFPNDPDHLNTLRLSNQVYSVLVVACLAKLRRRTWPRFVDVGRHTFGIYLSHALVFAFVLMFFHRLLQMRALAPYALNMGLRTGAYALAALMTWTTCFLIARAIAATPRLCWMTGLKPDAQRAAAPATESPNSVGDMSDDESTMQMGRATFG